MADATDIDVADGDDDAVPIQLQIRKVIFEKFNDPDLRFTNDEILDVMRAGDDVYDTCDVEHEFESLCKSGLARNIAQNFNTIWLKLFDVVDETRCDSCSRTIHLGRAEERRCPNPKCGVPLDL